MRGLPLALALSLALWALIVELAVGLAIHVGGPYAVIPLAEIAAAVPALMAMSLGGAV